MFIRSEKVRVPFKKSDVVRIYKCDGCGREMRVRQNWRGCTPPGGFKCSCGIIQTI